MSFTSIPSTYTDLVVKMSGRADSNPEGSNWTSYQVTFNGSTSSYTLKALIGTGAVAASTTSSSGVSYVGGWVTSSVATSNTFSNSELYIPNYAGSSNKSVSGDSVTEMNATNALASLNALLWSNTAAITSITLALPSGNWTQYSTATLYGIKNS